MARGGVRERTAEDEHDVAVEVGTIEALAPLGTKAMDAALIDVQIATAKQFPRSVTKAIKEATELATENEAVAEGMFYVLPKRKGGDKEIQGPSARLAEIMLFCWGNARAEAAVVSEDAKYITAVGTCFDLERNVAARIQVRRRITDKRGRRYGDDMVNVTGNAAVSVAYRNAVLKLIPRAFTERVYKAAQLASVGKGTLDQKRTKALDYFGQNGYAPEAVYALLGVGGYDDLGVEQIIQLRGFVNAVRDGETTLEELFNPEPPRSEEASKLDEALARGTDPDVGIISRAVDPDGALVKEAYEKASAVAAKMAKAGALETELSEALEEAHQAGDLEALINLDGVLRKKAKAHGVEL